MSGSRLARGGFLIFVGCFSELKYIDAQFVAAVERFLLDMKPRYRYKMRTFVQEYCFNQFAE